MNDSILKRGYHNGDDYNQLLDKTRVVANGQLECLVVTFDNSERGRAARDMVAERLRNEANSRGYNLDIRNRAATYGSGTSIEIRRSTNP